MICRGWGCAVAISLYGANRFACFLLLALGAAAWGNEESSADRRLALILEDQASLEELAEEGATEEHLLARAQRIAERYESFLERNPDHLYGWILCGKFLRSIGADGRALAAFRKAGALDPDLAVVQHQKGVILADLGEYRAALPFLLRAVELAPDEPAYREDLGRFLIGFGDGLEADGALERGRAIELAAESFGEAFRRDPGDFQRGWQWAETLGDVVPPDWVAVAEAWETVLSLAGSRAEREASRLQLARALIEAGETERAREYLAPVETPLLDGSRQALVERIGAKSAVSPAGREEP